MSAHDILLLSVWTDPVRVNPAYQFLRQELDRCSSQLARKKLAPFFEKHGAGVGAEKYTRLLQYDAQYPYCPGLLAVAAYLERAGFRVACRSLDLERIKRDARPGWLEDTIEELTRDVQIAVGVSAVTPELPRALEVLETVKRVRPELRTLIGGTHVTFLDEEAARHPAVDVVVRGEGEATALELMERWRAGVSIEGVLGTTRKRDTGRDRSLLAGELVRTPDRPLLDLSDIPRPAYHLLQGDSRHLLKITPTYSRGCPYACDYCVESTFWRRRVRHKRAAAFVDEIQYLSEEYNFRFIHIADSTFGVQREAVVALCDELERRKLDCVFSINARPDLFDYLGEPLIRRLVSLNFVEFFLGAETADDDLLRSLNRRQKHGQLLGALERLREIGVPFVKLYLMVGVPGDTHDSLRKTIEAVRLLHEQELIYYATGKFYVPAPGTPAYAKLAQNNAARADWGVYERYNYPPWFPHEELMPWEIEAYLLLLQGVQLTAMQRRLGVERATIDRELRNWANTNYIAQKYM